MPNLSWLAMSKKWIFCSYIKNKQCFMFKKLHGRWLTAVHLLFLCVTDSIRVVPVEWVRALKSKNRLTFWSEVRLCALVSISSFIYRLFFFFHLFRFTKAYIAYDKLNILNCTLNMYNLINCAINHTSFLNFF